MVGQTDNTAKRQTKAAFCLMNCAKNKYILSQNLSWRAALESTVRPSDMYIFKVLQEKERENSFQFLVPKARKVMRSMHWIYLTQKLKLAPITTINNYKINLGNSITYS